ncbi:MAG: RNA methyltransferase [Lentisphaeria bacterium]|nr:RNA methyltransferase [Lentisphaeria bacterium]NQZ67071.1 RNA methyltransferase [Lentisphaeria bacterium]
MTEKKTKSTKRQRADEVNPYLCKNLIAVIENPIDIRNIGTVIRNVCALGVEKTYIVDCRKSLPNDWQEMRNRKSLNKTSVSAVKWSFVKRFDTTTECLDHLESKKFTSIVTSPHVKGKENTVLHDGRYNQTRLAVWFGNESKGVSEEVVARSEFCIQIPMYGIIESLNLGTATGIVLYEVAKQRRQFIQRYGRRRPKYLKEFYGDE